MQFKPTLSSPWGKLVGAIFLAVGMVVGLVLTADFGGFTVASLSTAPSGMSGAPTYRPPLALDFPESVLAARSEASEPTETKVETVGDLEVSYEVPVVTAPPAPAPAPACVDDLTVTVNGLVAGVAGLTTLEQAGGLVEQVNGLGVAANACAQQVTALGSAGIDQLAQVGQQLNSVVAAVQALPVLAAEQAPAPAEAGKGIGNPVEKTLGLVGGGVGKTLDFVGLITGSVGDALGFVLNPTQQEH